jgi:hypothetical protein
MLLREQSWSVPETVVCGTHLQRLTYSELLCRLKGDVILHSDLTDIAEASPDTTEQLIV